MYLADVKQRGVPVAVFGTPGGGLARDFRSWQYMYDEHTPPAMPQTEEIIEFCVDLRMPPSWNPEEYEVVAQCLVAGFEACGPPARG